MTNDPSRRFLFGLAGIGLLNPATARANALRLDFEGSPVGSPPAGIAPGGYLAEREVRMGVHQRRELRIRVRIVGSNEGVAVASSPILADPVPRSWRNFLIMPRSFWPLHRMGSSVSHL